MQMLKNTKFHAQRPSRVFQTQQKVRKQTNKQNNMQPLLYFNPNHDSSLSLTNSILVPKVIPLFLNSEAVE